jgi:carboxypeptidase-like protein
MNRRLLIIAAAVLPSVLHAQVDTTARLMGIARSAFNGRPLSGVMIAVPGTRRFVVTDSSGKFLLSALPVGAQKVSVAYEGRATEEFEFQLQHGKTKRIEVVLDVEAIDLAPVVVEVQHRDFARNLAGFYERRKWYNGFARFVTREDIEKRRYGSLHQALTTEGVFTRCTGQGCIPYRWTRGHLCAVAVSVDGIPFWEQDYESIAIEDVQGVEVYRSAYGVPVSQQMTAVVSTRPDGLESAPTCGSIMIWTR